MTDSTAWRIFGLSKGGWVWLKRVMIGLARGSTRATVTSGLAASTGQTSAGGFSHQSASPLFSAATFVIASGMYSHSTRSTFTTLPPEAQLGGSLRGT